MILKPLQRIQVVESSKKCKAGSLGYFVAQDQVGSYNAWDMCIVFTRFGKKGKPRAEPFKINSFMINTNTMRQSDKEILDVTGYSEGLSPIAFVDRHGKFSTGVKDTVITPIPQIAKDLLELPDNEFTAYIIAMSIFIYKLTSRRQTRNLCLYPSFVSLRDFDASGYNLESIDAQAIGYCILHGIGRDVAMKKSKLILDDRDTFANRYAQQISTLSNKKRMLNKLQMALAAAKDELNRYNKATGGRFDDVSTRVDHVLKYYRRNKKKLENIKSNSSQGTPDNWGLPTYTSFTIELDDMPVKKLEERSAHWKQLIKVR